MASSGLRLVEVVRDYGKGVRIGPISCSVQRGEFVSLLGPSGCGKTTMLRCIAGFEPIDRGEVRIDDVDISRHPAHKRGVGLVFQNYALFPHLSVADNVAFGLRLRRVARSKSDRRVAEALRTVGLERLGTRFPAQLSGGQQQRVAIARSLVLEPSIMLLDEPLSNLDYKLRLQMRQELLALQRKLGMTFVYVTHDQTEALALSDRVIVLSNGRIEQEGTPTEVYQQPQTRFVADFIGASNLLEVHRLKEEPSGLVAHLVCGHRIRCTPAPGLAERSQFWVSIRPESAKILERDPDPDARSNVLFGRPVARVFSGDKVEVTLELELGDGAERSASPHMLIHADPSRSIPDRLAICVEPAAAVVVGDNS